jgi:hypothetical protein
MNEVSSNLALSTNESRTDPDTLSPLSMREVLRIDIMRRLWYSQLIGLVFSGILAQHIGVPQVFALCAGLLVVLTAGGRPWREAITAVEKAS